MKRFLMLVGVAVVAAAMYVAASPASQQSTGPSAKQFNALKKQFTALKKDEGQVKKAAAEAVGFLQKCFLSTSAGVVPVSRLGNTTGTGTTGYFYGTLPAASSVVAAIDVTPSGGTPGAYLQAVDPSCVNASALKHAAGMLRRAEHGR
ncbi:MAG TPA: hypothetical protein VE985_01565 [Gaiellaceae bacterium]|nr:hypothetical protein [Gaiellaceae bacterium]